MTREGAKEAIAIYEKLDRIQAQIKTLHREDWKRVDLLFTMSGITDNSWASSANEIVKVASSDAMGHRSPYRALASHILAFELAKREAEIPPLHRRLAQLGFKPEDPTHDRR